jgi:hypothetical protein
VKSYRSAPESLQIRAMIQESLALAEDARLAVRAGDKEAREAVRYYEDRAERLREKLRSMGHRPNPRKGVTMSFISKTPVTYYPTTGEVFRANPIPARAIKKEAESSDPMDASGIGRVDWDAVLSIKNKEIIEFAKTLGLKGSLLTKNAKTNKPREASGRLGEIAGLSLAPHYYPNFLNTAPIDEETGALQYVNREDFNTFRGRTPAEASEDSGVPKARLLNFCTRSSPYCRSSCLVFTGQNPLTKEAANSKINNTYAFLYNPELFVAKLRKDIISFSKSCQKKDLDPVVRLNMLSDLPWYSICPELLIECSEKYGTIWYDYTKLPFWRNRDYLNVAGILDLTFSFSGANEKACKEALEHGYRVAVVFAAADPNRPAHAQARTTFREVFKLGRDSGLIDRDGYMDLFDTGEPVPFINGDKSDYRIDDPSPSIVCLNFKQPSVKAKGIYKRLWEAIPEARSRFSKQIEDPRNIGAIYSKALRSRNFVKEMAAQHGYADPKEFDIQEEMDFDETLEAYADYLEKNKIKKNPLSLVEEPSVVQDDPSVSVTEETSLDMFPVKGTKLLVGPHVPTVLDD